MKYIGNLTTLLIIVLLASSTVCVAQTKTVTVTGMAATREGAIENGLIQAVQQVKGLSLKAALQAVRSGVTISKNGKRYTEYKTAQQSTSQLRSNGIIAGYEVIEEEEMDGLWNTTLSVEVGMYKTPGFSPNSRRKLAIVDFKANSVLKKNGVPNILLQKLTESLVQSRRFAVVDRTEDALYQQEKARWNSSDIAIEEKAKLGMRLGADYVVTGNILSFITSSSTKQLEMTGENYTVEKISAEVSYKVIVPATMQVKWSSTITYDITVEPESSSSHHTLVTRLSNKIANKISQDLLQSIYPIKVLNLAGTMLYLNMGGVNVKAGQKFTVYHLGEKLIDPYTNESLGQMETEVGVATIVDVKPKFAIAQIDEQHGIIAKGDICRAAKKTPKNTTSVQRKKSSVSHSNDGGVKLPYD